jgi:hypothetical protein
MLIVVSEESSTAAKLYYLIVIRLVGHTDFTFLRHTISLWHYDNINVTVKLVKREPS